MLRRRRRKEREGDDCEGKGVAFQEEQIRPSSVFFLFSRTAYASSEGGAADGFCSVLFLLPSARPSVCICLLFLEGGEGGGERGE